MWNDFWETVHQMTVFLHIRSHPKYQALKKYTLISFVHDILVLLTSSLAKYHLYRSLLSCWNRFMRRTCLCSVLIVPCVKLSCHDNQCDCFFKPVENNKRNIISMSHLKADSTDMFFFLFKPFWEWITDPGSIVIYPTNMTDSNFASYYLQKVMVMLVPSEILAASHMFT